MLRVYALGKESIAYIKHELEFGDTLASYLLHLQLQEGEITTYLPDGLSPRAILQFETGGVVRKRHTSRHLVSTIREFLDREPSHLAVFETLSRPGDPSLALPEPPHFVHKNEVYYFVTPRSNKSEISSAVHFARAYPFVGVLSSLPPGHQDVESRQELSANTLRRLALRSQYLLIGAYDHEAVLLWERKAAPLSSAQ